MSRMIFQLAWAAVIGLAATAAETNQPGPGVRVESYGGWDNALVLSGGDCRVVAVPAVGGHIVHYSINGDNILYGEPGSSGNTLARTPGGFELGGYHCDVGPAARGLPAHPRLILGPWRWKTPRPATVVLESEPDATLGVQLSSEMLMDPDSGEIGLLQRLTNVGKEATTLSLWDRTCCKGGGFGLVPLSKSSRYKQGWAVARQDAEGKTRYEAGQVVDSRLRVLDQVLVVEAKGPPLRVAADSDQGWIGYTVGRLLLVKYYPAYPKTSFPQGGHAVEFFCDERRAGLEPLGPEARLKPGESHVFPEKWALYDLEKSAVSFSEARALVKRIPASPFKK
jgi:hypothetical protein